VATGYAEMPVGHKERYELPGKPFGSQDLKAAFEPREVQSEDKAKMDARRMAALGTYAGVITWSRSADQVNGEFGDPVVLFQHGDVPEME
jgi:hypothetical protein